MGLAIFFTFPNLLELGLTRHTRRKSEPSRDDLPSMDDSLPPSKYALALHTHTITKSQSHIIRLLWEEKHGFCFVMIISYLYHMKLYYVQLLGGPTICEVCRLLAPRVRPCGGSVAAGRRKTKHIAVVSQRRALIAESQTAKPIKTLGIYWECMCTYAYIVIITG